MRPLKISFKVKNTEGVLVPLKIKKQRERRASIEQGVAAHSR
jgi:hypothetical protein